MTFHLSMGPGLTLVSGDSALIKADQRRSFEDAVHLLDAARSVLDAAEQGAAAARARAASQAIDDARATAREQVADRLATLSAAFEAENARRERDVAAAAFAAVRAMLGTFTDAELTARLADRATGHPAEGEEIRVEVAADLADTVRAQIGDRAGVSVIANPDLSPAAVRLSRGAGTLIADLDVQLANLAERWGLPAEARS